MMLGQNKMSAFESIKMYLDLSAKIFADKHWLNPLLDEPLYSVTPLEQALQYYLGTQPLEPSQNIPKVEILVINFVDVCHYKEE